MPRDSLDIHVYVSIPVGDSIMVHRVYRSCVVTINVYDTIVDLLLLYLVDFEVILGMDWSSLYHAILDFHAKTMTLAMPGLPRLDWGRSLGHSMGKVILFLKAQCIEKGCLAYLAFIRNSSTEVPSMNALHIVREFLEVFPMDLSSMP
ncbi:uncharacterized protein [Nicotiana tomentosiformis]|uniref:uncharacterized protein n=1 Tax=Nicotiana tomentosiformis TaxID=4098 RepID=UPI00388C808C